MRAPLFGLGLSSKSTEVTAIYRQNFYCEVRPAGEKSRIVAYGTPGLFLFANLGAAQSRGGLFFQPGTVSYVVNGDILYELSLSGVASPKGTLLTQVGRVDMQHNGIEVMIVDGSYGYVYNTQTGVFSQVTAPGFPALPSSVDFQDGYFIVQEGGSGRFQISGLYDGLTWDATDVGTAESNPDNLTRIVSRSGQLVLMGPVSMEFWSDTGASDFPYQRIQGAATEWGLAAKWSVAKFKNSIAFLAKNRQGQSMVSVLDGVIPQSIGNPDIDSIIATYGDVSDASAYSYMLGGHPMYVINFPRAGKTWLYDDSTKMWSAIKSINTSRHRAEFGFEFGGRMIVCDYENGKIYELSADAYSDNGDAIEGELISENVASPDMERFTVDRVRLDLETGVGNTIAPGENPQVSLQVSRDGGRTWGAEQFRDMGETGAYIPSVEWKRLGSSRQFNFKLRVSDPVKRAFVSAIINPSD